MQLRRNKLTKVICRTFPHSHFDFIHVRCLGGAIKDWPALITRCFKHLKPGGHLEVCEGRANFWCNDDTFPPECAIRQWLDEFHAIGKKVGIEFDIIPLVADWLREAGFEGVHKLEVATPIGTW